MIFPLHTKRLTLRALTRDDESLYCNIYGDVEAMRYIGPPIELSSAQRRFKRAVGIADIEPDNTDCLAVVEKASQASIGLFGLRRRENSYRFTEAGFILKPVSQRSGYAGEALAALVQVAFESLLAEEVWVQHAPGHARVARLVTRLGFSPGGSVSGDARFAARCVWSIHCKNWCYR